MTKFFNKISKSKKFRGCWEWQGTITKNGYGEIMHGYKHYPTHRLSYEYHKGEIGDYHVCHTCDNRKCVNPEHLWLGTPDDNQDDMREKRKELKKFYDIVKKIEIKQTEVKTFKFNPELRAIQKWVERENKKGKIFKYHVIDSKIFITRVK